MCFSAGGTAALLFSDLATAVHAFTPQVQLFSSGSSPEERSAQAFHDDAAWSESCLQMQSALPLHPPHIRNPNRQNAGEHLQSCMLPRIANTLSIAYEP